MQVVRTRRKRRRRPTVTPRFGPSSVALELGLLRLALEEEKDEQREKSERKLSAEIS